MEPTQTIDVTKLKMTSRLIVERAWIRGWKVRNFATNPAILFIYLPGKDVPIKIFSASPPNMSYPASKIANDKYITNQLLSEQGLPVPKEALVRISGDNATSDIEFEKYLTDFKRLVIKPLDASHGKGITTNIDSLEKLKTALDEAKENTSKKLILAQQQIEGIDIRAVCIDYKFVDAISRLPASVTGDGQHSVRELIGLTNKSDERGENYKAKLNYIPLDKVIQFLGEDKISEVPPLEAEVQVIGVSNIGMGGVRQNIRTDVPKFLITMAERAARVLDLPVCGVDFMVKRLPSPDDTEQSLEPSIIEVNACPMLTMYDDLNSPEQLAVIDLYLDFISNT